MPFRMHKVRFQFVTHGINLLLITSVKGYRGSKKISIIAYLYSRIAGKLFPAVSLQQLFSRNYRQSAATHRAAAAAAGESYANSWRHFLSSDRSPALPCNLQTGTTFLPSPRRRTRKKKASLYLPTGDSFLFAEVTDWMRRQVFTTNLNEATNYLGILSSELLMYGSMNIKVVSMALDSGKLVSVSI